MIGGFTMWTFHFDRDKEISDQVRTLPLLDLIEYSKSKGGQYRPFHTHDEFHVLYCTEGSGFLRLNDVDIELSPGRLAVIRPEVLHSCGSSDNDLTFWGISFIPSAGMDMLSEYFLHCSALTADFSPYMDYLSGIASVLLNLCGESGQDQSHLEDVRMHCYSLLSFTRMVLEDHPIQIPVPGDLPMRDVLHWIMDHYAEEITLDRLSHEFAMSSSHLSRSFFQSFRVSPINYLIDYRLSKAKDLLIFTDMPVYEIAAKVGYQNVYHFSNLFSKRIGPTPQEFREYCRKNTPGHNEHE